MSLTIDIEKGRKVAKLLYESFSTTGVHGRTEMPEDFAPDGVEKGTLEHLLFVTLTISIDYQRDAVALWESARRTFEDPETRYLFDPESLHKVPFEKIRRDMQKYDLSKKPEKDARIWQTVGVTFYKKWKGDPRKFLESCGWDALTILKRLREDTHREGARRVSDYPYLRGPKIGPLWVRVLRDNIGLTQLKNLDKVPIPVDVHVARATLATGVIRGKARGSLQDLFEHIREAWFKSVKGLMAKDRPMIALDVDEPLWQLSKYGCKERDKATGYCPVKKDCVAADFCVKGKIMIKNNLVELDTYCCCNRRG